MKKSIKLCFSVIILILFLLLGWRFYNENKDLFAFEKEDKKITVACVGDSLTFSRSYTEKWYLYPDFLSELLGEDYYVVNYGMAGSEVQGDTGYPYTTTRAYTASIEKKADIVIIMLGTNDVWGHNWKDEEKFYKYYVELVDSYLQAENKPEIYLCTIPAVFAKDSDFWGHGIQDNAQKIRNVIKKVAEEKNLNLIEMDAVTSQHPEWYRDDGVHFNYEGAVGVAEVVYEAMIDPIKVACVGDSITFRYGFEDEPENNYPYVLQELLGSEYWVKNFGESGTCVQENVDDAYITHDKYTESLEFQADILLFMLGTNDSKAWNWKDEESFRQAYEKMLDSYMDVENPPKVYVVISPKAFYINGKDSGTAEFGIEPEHVDQIVKIQLEVAEERGYSVINMYEISKANPTWFEEDGIHPTIEGAEGMAEVILSFFRKSTDASMNNMTNNFTEFI